MDLRHVYGAGFGLMSFSFGLELVGAVLSGADTISVGLDVVWLVSLGFLAWRSLTGKLDGLNDPGSVTFHSGIGYALLGMGVVLTTLEGYGLAKTLL